MRLNTKYLEKSWELNKRQQTFDIYLYFGTQVAEIKEKCITVSVCSAAYNMTRNCYGTSRITKETFTGGIDCGHFKTRIESEVLESKSTSNGTKGLSWGETLRDQPHEPSDNQRYYKLLPPISWKVKCYPLTQILLYHRIIFNTFYVFGYCPWGVV